MNERIMRMNVLSGELSIIGLDDAVSELSGTGLYSEIAPRLREGETVRSPNGEHYRAVAALTEQNIDLLPVTAVN